MSRQAVFCQHCENGPGGIRPSKFSLFMEATTLILRCGACETEVSVSQKFGIPTVLLKKGEKGGKNDSEN